MNFKNFSLNNFLLPRIETENLSLDELNRLLEEWIDYYNTKRLYFSLNFATLEEYLEKFKVSTI